MNPTVRRVLGPALMTLVMLAILIALGTWQVYRLHWKEGILAQIATAESAAPVAFKNQPSPYEKIFVTGRFRFDLAARFGADVRQTRLGPTMGSDQIVPLERPGQAPLLVDRGWIPDVGEVSEPAGEVTVVGYIRPARETHMFSAADSPAERRFYTMNPAVIGAALGVRLVPDFTLIAMGPSVPGSYPIPADSLPRPPNNHLSYVLTWYGLAVSLAVMFGVWLRGALAGG